MSWPAYDRGAGSRPLDVELGPLCAATIPPTLHGRPALGEYLAAPLSNYPGMRFNELAVYATPGLALPVSQVFG